MWLMMMNINVTLFFFYPVTINTPATLFSVLLVMFLPVAHLYLPGDQQ